MNTTSRLKKAATAALACAVACLFAPGADAATPTFVWSPSATDSSATQGGAQDTSGSSKWSTGVSMSKYLCRAPNGNGYVFELCPGNMPWTSFAALSGAGFSFSLYGDAFRVPSDGGKYVIAMFGGNANNDPNDKIVLFREGANLKLVAYSSAWAAVATASVAMPTDDAVHLYTLTADLENGGISLYVDDGSTLSNSDTAQRALTLSTGMQFGSIHGGLGRNGESGHSQCVGFAMVTALGFESAISASDVAALAADYPSYASAAGTLSSSPDLAIGNDYTLTLYDTAAATDQMYLGHSRGTLDIAEGSTVTVPAMRVLNANDNAHTATVNVKGTLVVTSTSTDPNVWSERNSYKGVLWGHWHGQGTYNITGSLLATNAYVETVFTAETQTINVDGGTFKAKGFYAYNDNSTINLYGGGTLEVEEILSTGNAINKNFRYGTFRVVADATETRAVNFSAAAGNYTTLDPVSHKLTFAANTVTGTGGIRVAPSDAGGIVEIQGVDASAYTGTILVESGTLRYVVSQREYSAGVTFSKIPVTGGTLVLLAPDGTTVLEKTGVTTDGTTIYTIAPQGNIWNNQTGDNKLSTAGNWTGGLPSDGDSFAIEAASDVQIDADYAVAADTVAVTGGGTATFTGTYADAVMTASNVVFRTPAVVAGTTFQPVNVTFEGAGTLAIDGGKLNDAVVAYSGALPTSGTAFTATTYDSDVTSSDSWGGTVWIKSVSDIKGSGTGNVFMPNNWGNALSTVRVSGVKGWIWSATDDNATSNTIVPALELDDDGGSYALWLSDGYSYGGNYGVAQYTKMTELKGNGTLVGSGNAPTVMINVLKCDAFVGTLSLTNKVVAFGSSIPAVETVGGTGGKVFVMEDAEVAVLGGTTVSRKWHAPGGIYVYGEIKAHSLDYFGAATTNYVSDTGKFTIVNTANTPGTATTEDFARITGTGTLRFESENTFRLIDANNFPINMVVENELGAGMIVPNRAEYTIGSLSGSGNFRSDWGGTTRALTVLQAKDTTWSGVFQNQDRFSTLTVCPGVSSAGTLTIAGMQKDFNDSMGADHKNTNDLAVATGASVAITGQWLGNVSVAGTLGGAGEVYGNVSLSDGASLSVDADSCLQASGAVTLAGEVTILLPEGFKVPSVQGKLLVSAAGGATLESGTACRVVLGGRQAPPSMYRVVAGADGLRLKTGAPFRVILR